MSGPGNFFPSTHFILSHSLSAHLSESPFKEKYPVFFVFYELNLHIKERDYILFKRQND